jgi:hypothetical protein
MNQIRRLCERCSWLAAGRLKKIGPTVETVSAYEPTLGSISASAARDGDDNDADARFLKWELMEPHCEERNVLASMGRVTVRFVLKVARPLCDGHHGIALFNNDNQLIWATAVNHLQLKSGICEFIYKLSTCPLDLVFTNGKLVFTRADI